MNWRLTKVEYLDCSVLLCCKNSVFVYNESYFYKIISFFLKLVFVVAKLDVNSGKIHLKDVELNYLSYLPIVFLVRLSDVLSQRTHS